MSLEFPKWMIEAAKRLAADSSHIKLIAAIIAEEYERTYPEDYSI